MQAVGDSSGAPTGLRYVSVCDGIGAAHVAWQPLGWQCQWTSEIEPFPVAVVEHHYGFRNLGDMTKITEDMIDAPVDLLVGGTPCQSFSVAGLRGGLADPRGNLALRFVQLAAVMQPRWVVWENVPGVLSSNKGRDFGTFLGALGELGYGFAYRVLDAQWFGVAQRRRRVFVVGYLGDWRRAAAVLFERESVFGNPPTRGAKGEGITSSPQGIAGNVSSKWSKGTGGPAGDECYNLVAFHPTQDPISSEDGLTHALGTGSSGGCATAAVAFTKSKRAQSVADDETWVPGEVSPTMRCFDQGDTRATTVVAFTTEQTPKFQEDCALTMTKQSPSGGGQPQCVAYDVHGTLAKKGASETDVHTALRRRSPGQSEASTTTVVAVDLQNVTAGGDLAGTLDTTRPSRGGGQAVAFKPPHYTRGKDGAPSEVAAPLSADADKGDQDTVVAFNGYQRTEQSATWPLGASDGRKVEVGVRCGMAVRRLTPRECERLQGFPDDYTLVTYRGKPACDGPRYRALGNSMAVPVMRWIGERIMMVENRASSHR